MGSETVKTTSALVKIWWACVKVSLLVLLLYVAFGKLRHFRHASAESLVRKHYAKEIDRICEAEDLPSAYFKALIMLECSGRKPAGSRFEAHIYGKLQMVKKGESPHYMNITTEQLKNMSDATLRQLATSWGPLQLMGYHCLALKIPLDDLKNENSLKNSILWCKKNYGSYLEAGDYKNAFHLHNTGRLHPQFWFALTHDPNYVNKGLNYMDEF